MLHLSKSALAVGAVVLAGGLITLTNPRTVHAVAAALVQVTNTASNPVVTQSTANQAAQIVHLVCNLDNNSNNQNCTLVSPQSVLSNGGPPYVVPASESFVINSCRLRALSRDAVSITLSTCLSAPLVTPRNGSSIVPANTLRTLRESSCRRASRSRRRASCTFPLQLKTGPAIPVPIR